MSVCLDDGNWLLELLDLSLIMSNHVLLQGTAHGPALKKDCLLILRKFLKSPTLPPLPVSNRKRSLSKTLQFISELSLVVAFLPLNVSEDDGLVKLPVQLVRLRLALLNFLF
jgi:hypothetical protein